MAKHADEEVTSQNKGEGQVYSQHFAFRTMAHVGSEVTLEVEAPVRPAPRSDAVASGKEPLSSLVRLREGNRRHPQRSRNGRTRSLWQTDWDFSREPAWQNWRMKCRLTFVA